jgi:L-lactate utilization protein LutB
MNQFEEWFRDCQVERATRALEKNGFAIRFVPKAADAARTLVSLIPEGATIGVGGSMTLNEIGFFDELAKRRFTLLNPSLQQMTLDEFTEMRRRILNADVFVCSSNAVTEDGKLYNVDGTGNRVAAMTFGPRKVILACGINKIVKDVEEAERRVRNWAAPMNARRLGLETPCTKTGVCSDCSSPQRICNIHSLLVKRPIRTDFTVLLIGERLGF